MLANENIKYAAKNLWKRKLRSSLTILSIFVGITTIFIFISFGMGLYTYINDLSSEIGVDKLIIQVKGIGAPGTDDTFSLGDSDLRAIEQTRGVIEAIGLPFSAVAVKKGETTRYAYLVGMPLEDKAKLKLALETFTIDIETGRMLEEGEDNKVLLGSNYQKDNNIFQKGLAIGDKVSLNGYDFKILGFFEEVGNPQDDSNVYVTIDAYKKLTGSNIINYAIIEARVDDVSRIEETRQRAIRNLRRERGLEEGKEDFYIQTAQQLIESFSAALNIVIGFIILIAIISVLVSAINTANTMFTSILERTKEIGVLKAIGAQNKEIMSIFLLESSILGIIAGIIGVAVGYLLSSLGGLILTQLGWGFLQPLFTWQLFAGCILFATLVGTLSGIIPALNASRQKPVDSLRYE